MGHQDRPNATKRTSKAVMPTLDEIEMELQAVAAETKAELALMVPTAMIAKAAGVDLGTVTRAARRHGIKAGAKDPRTGGWTFEREAAKKLVRILAGGSA